MREAIQAWLDAQCSDLQGVSDAVIMLVPRGGQVRLAAAATWPRGVKASDELQAAAVKAFDAQVPSVTPLAQPGRRRRSVIAHPVQVGSRTVGAVAIAMHAQARSGTQVVLAGVERGAVNFESFLRRWRTAHAAPAPGDTFFKTGAFTAPAAAMAASEPSAASRTHQAPLSGNRRNRAITFRLTSLSRISPWLVGLLILLVPFGALLVGLLPDRSDVARQVSERTAESLAARVLLTLLLASAGLSVFYLYMRQVLRRTAVTPDQARTVLDALSEGVVVVDQNGTVLLANRAFRQLNPRASRGFAGQRIENIEWLAWDRREDPDSHPWVRAMKQGKRVTGEFLKIRSRSGEEVKIAINCSPIHDGCNQVRGCLIAFDDLSVVDHMNRALLDLVSQLDAANDHIQKHNEELKHLASRDQLTGVLTRRAFMEQAEHVLQRSRAQRGSVSCVMADIDHFKSINDRYGHLVGDLAIGHVADVLKNCVRAGDLVCRFGGEEFCVLLPRATEHDAMEVAERMRATIESTAGSAVVPGDHVRITSSFGVSSIAGGSVTLSELIRQADQALYAAKAMGRNRVMHGDGSIARAGAAAVPPRQSASGADAR